MRAAALLRHARLAVARSTRSTYPGVNVSPRRALCGALSARSANPPPPCVTTVGRQPLPSTSRRRRSSSASTVAAAATATGTGAPSSLDRTPLVERPPSAVTTLADLAAWTAWARAAVAALGSDGLAADGGPSAAELQVRANDREREREREREKTGLAAPRAPSLTLPPSSPSCAGFWRTRSLALLAPRESRHPLHHRAHPRPGPPLQRG